MSPQEDQRIKTHRTGQQKRSDTGPNSAGQSGDNQGLSENEEVANQSVEELVEEGQFYEAAIVSGVENAADADEKPIRTKQVREDDVPEEYLDNERPTDGQ